MPQLNDLSRSLVALEQDATLIAVIEMGQSRSCSSPSWLAASFFGGAPLVDPVPVRRLVLSFPADRQTPRLARFAGKAIVDIVADQVERAVWVGQLLDGKAGQQ
jgi:hypothetical protein